jgi:transposase
MAATISRETCEYRRIQGLKLLEQGWSQRKVANALGVTQGAVSQWLARYKAGGDEALRLRKAKGREARLTFEQQQGLLTLLAFGAEAFGFEGDVWTCLRVARLIKAAFNVEYHPSHVSKLLRKLGWSLQKPVKVPSQRDEEAIRKWLEEDWPTLKKTLKNKAPH